MDANFKGFENGETLDQTGIVVWRIVMVQTIGLQCEWCADLETF
jgi:hypothetical protein